MQKKFTPLLLGLIGCMHLVSAQTLFRVEGDGQFLSPASTNVDIYNTDDNTNTLVRFGDNAQAKVSLGFNGNEDVFKISTAATLGADDFTMDLTGLIGINTLPGTHRMLINHNSSSGVNGSAQLTLQENNTNDFARLRFGNLGSDGLWTISTRATDGDSKMNFFYNDGASNFNNVLSLDGDLFRVGILTTTPEAYLHIKQDGPGVSALILENDDQTGGEKWGMQIGNTNLDFLFEDVIRGSFSSATGAYTAFPPPAAFTSDEEQMPVAVLSQVLQLRPVKIPVEKSGRSTIGLDPADVEQVNAHWVVRSEDGTRMGINYQQFVALAVKSVQEQQDLIESQAAEIAALEKEEADIEARLSRIEALLAADTPQELPQSLPQTEPADQPLPSPVGLEQNRPNPFQTETVIELRVPDNAVNAILQINNVRGQQVRKYNLSKGSNQLTIKAGELEKGTYFYSLIVDGELIETRQLIRQ